VNKFLETLKNFRTKKCLAFVLGGGGARGAFQAGALQALQEEGLHPNLLVGTSIGAANAAFVAIKGFTPEGIHGLREVWIAAAQADLLPVNYLWLTVRGLFGRQVTNPAHRLRDFLVHHGLPPDLRFGDLDGIRLLTISADLNSGKVIKHGLDPHELVLDGVLASAALPPWMSPIHRDHRYLIDGGFLSSLPVEPAMAVGATEIIALDLSYPVDPAHLAPGFGTFMEKLVVATELRQAELELALAKARRIPVTHIRLDWPTFIPPWDFHYMAELLDLGYQAAKEARQGG
jgi:NTE family protein